MAFESTLLARIKTPKPASVEAYRADGGYVSFEQVLKEKQPLDVVNTVKDSGLRGRGGAGFPTGLKWTFLPKDLHPRYLAVNFDESEPATFKDRYLCDYDPHVILEGIAITARTSGNAVIEEALFKVRQAVEEGRNMMEPLAQSGVFPNMVCHMVGIGEATGALDTMLHKIADFFEDDVDAATKDLLSSLEPLIIGVLGVVVGGIVLSLYMPLFSMISKLAG